MNIIILGPQGSGKGTQAKFISEKFGLFYFESGEFLRELAKSNPKIDETINKKGQLVSDEEMSGLAFGYIEKKSPSRDNILFEGFPRTTKQYEILSDWLAQKGKLVNLGIVLEISEEESIKRLSARRTDPITGNVYNLITNPPPGVVDTNSLVVRPDDEPEAIKERLRLYHEYTQPLLDILDKEGILVRVNGERPIEVIAEELFKEVERRKS